jgi:hypothetical protein
MLDLWLCHPLRTHLHPGPRYQLQVGSLAAALGVPTMPGVPTTGVPTAGVRMRESLSHE